MLEWNVEFRSLRLKRPFRISRGEKVVQENAFLKLSDGVFPGWGEAARTGYGPDAVRQLHAELLPASEIINAIDPALDGAIDDVVRRCAGNLPPESGLRCALESALCDLVGRRRGMPLWRLFGLDGPAMPTSSFTLGIDDPDTIREKLAEADGLPILKIKLGSEHDEQVLSLVRGSTDAVIRVDANGGWTPENAPDRLKLCADCGVELIEQPLPQGMIDESAGLAEKSPVPIVLDEDCRTTEDVEKLSGRVDGVNVKLRKSGGVWSALQVIKKAKTCGLKVMIGCFIESTAGIAASAHLGPLADWIDLDGHQLISNDPFTGLGWDRGKLTLPPGPGLGIEPL